jgi:hypothetical protein
VDHAVSTTDGKVPPEEKLRLENLHGKALAAEIVAEVEAAMAPPEPPKTKAKAAPTEEIA